MEALYQGASAGLVLAGLAVMLLGIAALWWAVGRVRAEQEQVALERAACERAAARVQHRADAERRRVELVRALVPTAAAAVGHWLGRQSGRHEREASAPVAPCCGPLPPFGRPPPYPPMPSYDRGPEAPDDDDETQVELDFESLLESIADTGFGDWLATMMRKATAEPTTTATPAPESAVASPARA